MVLPFKYIIPKIHPEAYSLLCWTICCVVLVVCYGLRSWSWNELFALSLPLAASAHYLKPHKKGRRRKYDRNGNTRSSSLDNHLKRDPLPTTEEANKRLYEPLETARIEITSESFIRETGGGCFSSPDSTDVKIRGPNYLQDKIKIFSAPSLFRFVHNLTFTQVEELVNDTTEFDWCWYRRAQPPQESFTIIINFQLMSIRKQIISYFYIEKRQGLPESVKLFLENNDEYRKNHFKMIPRLTKAPLFIRLATPMAPAIIARKIDVEWIPRSRNCLSIVMKPDSSLLAANIIRMAHPASKKLIVDLFFCIEGKLPRHLPEQVLCGIRWEKLDLKQFETCERVRQPGSDKLQWMKRMK